MTRRAIAFACDGATLFGSLDEAPAPTGLLIVSGGNEIRAGAWGGQAQLAGAVAVAGHPVLRFDRRGVGESEGANAGFRGSGPDIAAALAAFRAAVPGLQRVVGFGNCDAASALMLGAGCGCDGLVLANPWTFEDVVEEDVAPVLSPSAVRARYLAKLTDPREVWRLLSGGVNLAKLARGLRTAAAPPPPPSSLVQDMAAGLSRFTGPARILLASRDRTAQAFGEVWPTDDPRIRRVESGSHSFSDQDARAFLLGEILAALAA